MKYLINCLSNSLGLGLAAVWVGGALACAGSSTTNPASALDAASGDASSADGASSAFAISGVGFTAGGLLPIRHTCDGSGASPGLAWSGAPAGTTEFALLMTTVAPVGAGAPNGIKWNWVLYAIPASTTALAEAASGIGTNGITSDGPKLAYAPPCSQGPGAKAYTFTLYALSASPTLPSSSDPVSGSVLTAAIAPHTLASATFTVTFTR